MPYVFRLDESRPLAEVGGKAFHLARMLSIQLPVPDGIVITTAAWQLFLDHNQLRDEIERLLAEGSSSSNAIRELILAAEIPATISDEIAASLPGFPADCAVAVRSSAVGEDSARDSFAGQLDSILHVDPRLDAVCRALKCCWASYWSERVLFYQQSRRVKLQGMAVVVQEQVAAAWSGVLFTQHPCAAQDQSLAKTMLLEYCPGLGDQLVSGNISPSSVVLSRIGVIHGTTPHTNSDESALEPEQLVTLARYGIELEQAFGGPQDIEWSIASDGQVHLLQSRPITVTESRESSVRAGARVNPPKSHDLGHLVVWSNANVNENYPDPICPLLYSIASAGYYHYFRNLGLALGVSPRRVAAMEQPLRHLVGVHGARLYYNLTNIYAVLRMAPFGDWLSKAFGDFVGAEQVASADGDLNWRGFARSRLHQGWEVAGIAVRSSWQFLFLKKRVKRFEQTVDRFAEQTRPESLAQQSSVQLLGHLRGFLEIRCHRWLDASLADAAAMLSYGALKRLLNHEFPEAGEAALHNSLLKGLRDVVSGVPAARLWELSRRIRTDQALRLLFQRESSENIWRELSTNPRWSLFQTQLQSFLDEWGFRCSGELMLTVPSFQERPEALIEILQSYAALDGESPAERLARQEIERKKETAEILSQLRGRWLAWWLPWPRKSLVARWLLGWTQQAIVCRERARLKQALLYSRLRRIVLTIGERLVERECLARREDVFFLTVQELDSLLAGSFMYAHQTRELIALRQSAHEDVTRVIPPGHFSLPAGEYWEGEAPAEPLLASTATKLKGLGVCGGKVTATAVVLRDVTEMSRLAPRSILVTRQTDPGWGPVFPLIQGLVIERGGMLSHGAILAREYGLPTVVGIAAATERIRSGQTVTVDGDQGLVELH